MNLVHLNYIFKEIKNFGGEVQHFEGCSFALLLIKELTEDSDCWTMHLPIGAFIVLNVIHAPSLCSTFDSCYIIRYLNSLDRNAVVVSYCMGILVCLYPPKKTIKSKNAFFQQIINQATKVALILVCGRRNL